ncbi:hypothetical protein SASK087_24740 [Staphylococcus argenteus]
MIKIIEFTIAKEIDNDIKKNQIFQDELLKFNRIITAIQSLKSEKTKHKRISKAEISRSANMNYSTTLIKLRFLEKYGFISFTNKVVTVLRTDVENAYPFTMMSLVKVWKVSLKRYCDVVEKDMINILDIPAVEELSIAEGYFQLFSTNKNYEDYILEKLKANQQ